MQLHDICQKRCRRKWIRKPPITAQIGRVGDRATPQSAYPSSGQMLCDHRITVRAKRPTHEAQHPRLIHCSIRTGFCGIFRTTLSHTEKCFSLRVTVTDAGPAKGQGDQRALQNRVDPSSRTVTNPGICGTYNFRIASLTYRPQPMEPLGSIRPVEARANACRHQNPQTGLAVQLNLNRLHDVRGGSLKLNPRHLRLSRSIQDVYPRR